MDDDMRLGRPSDCVCRCSLASLQSNEVVSKVFVGYSLGWVIIRISDSTGHRAGLRVQESQMAVETTPLLWWRDC